MRGPAAIVLRLAMVLVALVGALALLADTPTRAEPTQRRVALVIGNAKYKSVAELGSPARDVAAVEAALKRLKFDVVTARTDLGQRAMSEVLAQFRGVARGADVAILYYSGHGIEIDGTNYLIPTDATLEDPSDAQLQAIPLPTVMRQLDGVRGLRMVILDACRDNPFQQRLAALPGRKSTSAGKGFTAVAERDIEQRTVVAFAAREGTTAEDRPGRVSTYTDALLKHIETPALEVRLLLGRVSDDVRTASGGKQVPQEYGSLGGQELYLVPPVRRIEPQPPLSAAAREWQDVKGSRNPVVLQAFRERHKGDPVYVALADEAIAALRPPEPRPAPTPVAPPATPVAVVPPARCTSVEVDVAGVGKRCLDPARSGQREFQDCFDLKGKRVCGPKMVAIPDGRFLMGTSNAEIDALIKAYPQTDAKWFRAEAPEREVTIAQPFAASWTHVTRGEFRAFMTSTGHKIDGGCYAYDGKEWKLDEKRNWLSPGFDQDDSHPVVCVNWHDAQAYAAWLGRETSQTYRLLTEAEAEYVARAVRKPERQPRYFFGDNPKDMCRYGNGADLTGASKFKWDRSQVAACEDGYATTAPAGSFAANLFGVRDVHGNVWTWVADCFADSYANAPTDGSKAPDTNDCSRVLRGGSWYDVPQNLRAAVRIDDPPDIRLDNFGFRLARTLPPTP